MILGNCIKFVLHNIYDLNCNK